jgi:N-acetylneuraminate synthase
MAEIKIGDVLIGDNHPCYIVAEIGINHNGDVGIAKRLIDVAVVAGCNAVKFQKRDPDSCVPLSQQNKMRETPWGYITYLEYRRKVEFGEKEYKEIDDYCRKKNVQWFVSSWDQVSLEALADFDLPCYKISSACLTDINLLKAFRSKKKPLILSTGMSTIEQIDKAVEVLGKKDLIILHSTSTYPAYYEELNLRAIKTLRERYGVLVGYSGHETGIASSVAAVALGACMIERHITLDRSMWGSDQAASLEPSGTIRLVRDIRLVETSMGDGIKRVFDRELPIMERLRRVEN